MRHSRELCGCNCRFFCQPDTCSCARDGIKCQVCTVFLLLSASSSRLFIPDRSPDFCFSSSALLTHHSKFLEHCFYVRVIFLYLCKFWNTRRFCLDEISLSKSCRYRFWSTPHRKLLTCFSLVFAFLEFPVFLLVYWEYCIVLICNLNFIPYLLLFSIAGFSPIFSSSLGWFVLLECVIWPTSIFICILD